MSKTLPTHVGIILDGNRRWAKGHGFPTVEGHRQGAEALKRVALFAFDHGVTYLSAYVFSTENWQRSPTEVSFLMKLFVKAVQLHLDEFHQKNVKIVILGSQKGVPKAVSKALGAAVQKTANNKGGTLALCLNYGGKQELVDAVQAITAQGVAAKDITKELIGTYIYQPTLPQLDLIIRTSGEQRTSGFMLWRSDYAELLFIDKLWPDFTVQDFTDALTDFANRQRRYGG